MIDLEGRLDRIDYGDRVFFDSVSGIAGTTYPIGTAGMPSNAEADVITICAARGLKKISIYGLFTVPSAMEGYEFIGHGQYSALDTIDFNAQDVDTSVFRHLNLTGAQGGTAHITMEDCHLVAPTNISGTFFRCLIQQATLRNSTIDMVECSGWQGAAALTVDAPNPLNMFGWSGAVTLGGMTGGIVNIFAQGALITILNTCTGGTINIYGNARVTDNSGAGCTVNDYSKETQLDAIEGAVGGAGSVAGKPNVQEVVIYPVAEDAGTTELDDNGTNPTYYPVAPHSTNSNAEGTPGVAWAEDIDFEQEGTINLISIYAEFEWQTLIAVGGGDATNSISKIQISRDGGANWVDLTDNFINPGVAMTNRIRAGVGLWIPTIVAGANQLQFRLVHWTDDSVGGAGRSTSEAQIRSNSYVRTTYRKA